MAWLIAAAGVIAMAAASRALKRRSRHVPLHPLPPQLGDDVIAMHARWHDEKLTAELERILSEGDGNG